MRVAFFEVPFVRAVGVLRACHSRRRFISDLMLGIVDVLRSPNVMPSFNTSRVQASYREMVKVHVRWVSKPL